jgi:UDP-3-O-[3-hydroxymyristoyl] glucosamine N-acyltransferase
MTHRSLQELAALCGAVLEGDPELRVRGPASLAEAEPEDISFFGHARYQRELERTKARALVVPVGLDVSRRDVALLRCEDAHRAFERVLDAFDRLPRRPDPGVHATAVISPTARIGRGASIGAYCVIGDEVEIGEGAVLYPHVCVARLSRIGAGSELRSHVVLHERVEIGERCLIQAGAILGGDGFGFDPVVGPRGIEGWSKAPHAGSVVIEDEVEIGANCTVDRGRFSATRIGRGAKLDNLVHVGHNVQIGEHALLIAQVGLAGSCKIGRGVIVAGQAGVGPQLEVGEGARIAPASAVFENVPAREDVMGYWARPKGEYMRELALRRRLGELSERVRALEKSAQAGGRA